MRDLGLLDSAVHRTRASVMGQDAYPDLITKAAALLHSLARNHPFVDGNKRLAWLATYVFCAKNDVELDPPTTTLTTWSSPWPAERSRTSRRSPSRSAAGRANAPVSRGNRFEYLLDEHPGALRDVLGVSDDLLGAAGHHRDQ